LRHGIDQDLCRKRLEPGMRKELRIAAICGGRPGRELVSARLRNRTDQPAKIELVLHEIRGQRLE
jgi:hypothetical protein